MWIVEQKKNGGCFAMALVDLEHAMLEITMIEVPVEGGPQVQGALSNRPQLRASVRKHVLVLMQRLLSKTTRGDMEGNASTRNS